MKDVDLDNRILHVLNAKNNKDRDIPVSESVIEYMRWYCWKIHANYLEKYVALMRSNENSSSGRLVTIHS